MSNSGAFTRFSHQLLNGIIESELNLRQIKVILLIQRLSSGCHREWTTLKQSDFQGAGITPNHIEEVKKPLLEMGVLLQNGGKPEYKINEDYFIKAEENPTRLTKLIGSHLPKRSSQKRKATIPKEGISNIPKWEETCSQDGNSTSHDLALMKDKFIDKIKNTDKDTYIGFEDRSYEKIIQNPQSKIESDAVELHQMLEPDNIQSFPYYLKILHRVSINRLYPIASEIKNDTKVEKHNMGKLFVYKTRHLYNAVVSG